MKRKAKTLVTICISLLLLLMNVLGSIRVYAQEEVKLINPNPENIILIPGETRKLKVPIKSVGGNITNVSFTVDAYDTPYTISTPVLVGENDWIEQTAITEFWTQYLEFEVSVAETAKKGKHPISIMVYGTVTGAVYSSITQVFTVDTRILEEKEDARLTVSNVAFDKSIIGKDTNLSFVVNNKGELTAEKVSAVIEYPEGVIAGYSDMKVLIDDIKADGRSSLSLPVKILSTASPGLKTLRINLTYRSEGGDTTTEVHDFYLTIDENENAPQLILDNFIYNVSAKPGDKLGLELSIKNNGSSKAESPRIYVDESSLGTMRFIKDYYTDYIETKDIRSDQVIKVDVPLMVSNKNTGGEYELKLNIVYFDGDGVEYISTATIYLQIEAEGITEEGKPIVLISNVLQSPAKPVAGERLEVSFDMVNKSAVNLNELKISLMNLTGNTFIPVESDPYQYIGELKGGASKRITIALTVSDNIQEGLNNLLVDYSYTGGGDSINIPILDVQNDFGSASKPRLIISKYEVDIDELRAGSTFNFNFEIHNTHSSVAAKNIIATVSGKPIGGSDVFTVTQGSNSFFISKIGPGETFSGSLGMKVKSDAATNAYPIGVTIEYEYDGIEPNPTTGKIGETEDYELNLQVIENARPVVDYVNVYSWDMGVTVGNPASLSFEFYNMGKSMLNNVVATVEGDFSSSGSSMYFMGNVMAGGNAYAELEVIPNVEGTAYGVVKITYEDSNGEEQVYTKEFETFVMGMQPWEPGPGGDGGVDVFNPIVPEPKKEILPLWAFIVMLVLIFIIFIPASRKIIISIYKNRLRKKEGIY